MSICIRVCDEHNSILTRFEGEWQWSEFLDAHEVAATLAGEARTPVAYIFDYTDTDHMPDHYFAHASVLEEVPAPSVVNQVIVVGASGRSPLHRRMVRLASLGDLPLTTVDTLAEAFALLDGPRAA